MSTEDELRADLDRSTRALERAAETARKAATTIAELQAEIVLAEQKMTTWMEAAAARTSERDDARKELADAIDDATKTKIILSGANDEIAALKKRLAAAAGAELDALAGALEQHLKMWRACGRGADEKAGAVEALADVLNMVRRRRAGEA